MLSISSRNSGTAVAPGFPVPGVDSECSVDDTVDGTIDGKTQDPTEDTDAGLDIKFDLAFARQRSGQLRQKILVREQTKATPPIADTPAVPLALSTDPNIAGALINKNQALRLIQKMQRVLTELRDSAIAQCMVDMVGVLGTTDLSEITVLQWAKLSSQLGKLSVLMEKYPAQVLPVISPLHFVRLVILNLQQYSSHARNQLAKADCVGLLTEALELQVFGDPAMLKTQTSTASFDFGLILPLLSVGVAAAYSHSEFVNDDMELVEVSGLSVAATVKASAVLAAAKGKLQAGVVTNRYCKSPSDHVLNSFDKLLAANKNHPEIAHNLSLCAMPTKRAIPIAMPADFAVLSNAALEQITQRLSVFLSLDYAAVKRRHSHAKPPQPEIGNSAVINKKIRPTESVITTMAGTASGSLGLKLDVVQFNAALTVSRSAETRATQSERTVTYCELLKNNQVDKNVKQALAEKLRIATSTACAYWFPDLPADLKKCAQLLEQNFTAYAKLHAQRQQGDAIADHYAQASIREFHRTIGAKTVEEYLLRLAQLTALLYSLSGEQENSVANEQLKSQLINLEAGIHGTSIPHQVGYLDRHAMARRAYRYDTSDQVVKFSVTAGMAGVSAEQDLGVKITWRKNDGYYNFLRAGQHVIVDFYASDNPEINQRIVAGLKDYFRDSAPEISDYFSTATFTKSGYQSARFYRSGKSFASYKLWIEREINYQHSQWAIKAPVPMGMAGLSRASTQVSMKSEKLSSTTLNYFALHFMLAVAAGHIDGHGDMERDCYWHRIERDHVPELLGLFRNYAQPGAKRNALLEELQEMESGLLMTATPQQIDEIMARKATFFACAGDGGKNYPAALASFKKWLLALYPCYVSTKDHSGAYLDWELNVLG